MRGWVTSHDNFGTRYKGFSIHPLFELCRLCRLSRLLRLCIPAWVKFDLFKLKTQKFETFHTISASES